MLSFLSYLGSSHSSGIHPTPAHLLAIDMIDQAVAAGMLYFVCLRKRYQCYLQQSSPSLVIY